MKPSDWIAGAALFVGGAIVYLSNYKLSDKQGKMRARVGLGIMFGGALLSVGQWMFNLVLSGH
jgi:hypothetical protein